MTIQIMRRNFLKGLGAVSAAATLPGLSAMNAYAQAGGDYKALVCLFLYGGCDGNNVIVPMDERYNLYGRARGSLTLPYSSLVPLAGTAFGLHPSLAALQDVWSSGRLAFVLNTGTLVEPLTRAQLATQRSSMPDALFSHDEQQAQMQSAVVKGAADAGWGARLNRSTAAANRGSAAPGAISVTGNDVFLRGAAQGGFSVPVNGRFGLGMSGGDEEQVNARRAAVRALLGMRDKNFQVRAATSAISTAVDGTDAVAAALNGAGSIVHHSFDYRYMPNLANQLLAVAKMIEARDVLGNRRQIFFAGQGGFDQHESQLPDDQIIHYDVAYALRRFYDALAAIGAQDKVTVFTLSDFGRTLRENDGGSDHAWGNHLMVMGGAVKGGMYGTFPEHALGGPDDADRDGRWIPTIAVDQYAATLARWFGVPDADLPAVVPNVGRFATANLGFMG